MKKITLIFTRNRASVLAFVFFTISCFFAYKLYIKGESVYSAQMVRKFYMIEQSLSNSNIVAQRNILQTKAFLFKKSEREPAKAQTYLDAVLEIDSAAKANIEYINALKNNFRGRIYQDIQGSSQIINIEHDVAMSNIQERIYGIGLKKRLEKLYNYTVEKCSKYGIKLSDLPLLKTLKATSRFNLTTSEWARDLFENIPLEGMSTILTKIENDIIFAEAEVISEFALQINECDFRFNRPYAIVIPKSTISFVGEKYEAEITMVPCDCDNNDRCIEKIYVDNIEIKAINGVGKFEQQVTEGIHRYKGKVIAIGMLGQLQSYEFEGEYTGCKLPPNIKR